MPGPPVTIGAVVTLTPGAAGPPDTGVIISVAMPFITANGMPLATAGSTCQMINSLTGVPYSIVIPPSTGVSTGALTTQLGLVRLGDRIAIGPATLLIAGAPPMPTLVDTYPP
jgi:uncharacterized Zn-binding protein involved in type VI secretion